MSDPAPTAPVLYLDVTGYTTRAGAGALLPKTDITAEDGSVTRGTDTERITRALRDASGLCRGYLPQDLVTAAGAVVPIADLPERLSEALPGICYALARFALADGETGENDLIARGHKAAIAALERLANRPDRATVVATIEDGVNAGAYIPGLPADDD